MKGSANRYPQDVGAFEESSTGLLKPVMDVALRDGDKKLLCAAEANVPIIPG